MKILVTGNAGFIGFHTAKMLVERGDTAIGFDGVNDYYDTSIKEMLSLRPGDVPDTYADVRELVRAIGYKPVTLVRDSLKAFVNWYWEHYGA